MAWNRFRSGPFCSLLVLAPAAISGQTPPPVATPAPPQSEMRRAIAWRRLDYTCEAGATVRVFLRNQTVRVTFKDKTYAMRQVPSADGARYSDGKVVWWSVGNGGFLEQESPEGRGALIVKDCKLDPRSKPAPAGTALKGTLGYPVQLVLPPRAVVQIELLDGPARDAPIFAGEEFTLGDRQAPIPFSVPYDPVKIVEAHTYRVRARILVDGQVRFVTDQDLPVISHGEPGYVELTLKPFPPAPPAKP